MELRNDEGLEGAVAELNTWVQRLNEVYGAWQVGWGEADVGMQKACGEIATACRRVEAALLALKGEAPSPGGASPTIDLSEIEAQLGLTEE